MIPADRFAAVSDALNHFSDRLHGLAVMLHQIDAKISAPVEIIRDSSNRPVAIRKAGQLQQIIKGSDGRIVGTSPVQDSGDSNEQLRRPRLLPSG